jgi:hypothetical protein
MRMSERLTVSGMAERMLPNTRLTGRPSRLGLRLLVEVTMVIATLAVWLVVGLQTLAAQAQTGKVWRIGVLTALYPPDADPS